MRSLTLVLALAAVAFAQEPPKEPPKDSSPGAKERAEARILMEAGKLEEARELLKSHVKGATEDFQARILLGRVETDLGNFPEAGKQYRAVIDNDEKDIEATGLLAEICAATGQHEEGLKLAEAALKKNEAALNARVAKGAILLETGKGDEAEKTLSWLEEYLDKAPSLGGMEQFTIARGLWMLALRRGDKDLIHRVVDGGGLLNEAYDVGGLPKADVLAFWGHCYMDKYQAVYAKHSFDDALKANPKCASAIFGQARVLLEGGKMPQAGAAVDQALQLNPRLFDALLFKALILAMQQQVAPAEAVLKAALEINPRSVQALSLLAASYETQGKKAEREKVEADLAKINPNCGLAWYYIGEALGNKMLFEEANAYLKKAVEADPKLWDAYIEYGMNSLRLGDEVTALKYLSEAYERDPFHIRLVNTMTLMDSFPKEFTVVESRHFRIRMTKKEVDIIGPYVVELHERCWDELARRYKFEPQVPIVCDMYSDHDDFSVRTVGTSGLGALGACFGRVCTLLSPRAKEVMGKFNWGSVIWHELGHVWALQLSKNRVPRWFTEGLSTYEEKLGYPGWERELEAEIFQAFHGKTLKKIKDLHAGGDLLNLYLYGSLITEFIATRWHFDKIPEMLKLWGEGKDTETVFQTALGIPTDQFDTALQQWIGDWLKNVGLRMPFRANPQELKQLEETIKSNPMDAASMGRYARILAQSGEKADAETWAKRALKVDEECIDALVVMGEAMGTAERRRFDKAAEFYSRAVSAGAKDFQTLLARALMLMKAEDWAAAVPALEEAKAAFPRYIGGKENPYAKLIEIYRQQKNEEAELKELEALVAIDHDSFGLRMDLAAKYQARGDREKLVKTLESAIYIGVFDTRLHAWLGRAYRDMGKQEKALHEFRCCVILLEQAAKTEPSKWSEKIAEFKAESAKILKGLGKVEEARQAAKEAILLDPENALAREVLEGLEKE